MSVSSVLLNEGDVSRQDRLEPFIVSTLPRLQAFRNHYPSFTRGQALREEQLGRTPFRDARARSPTTKMSETLRATQWHALLAACQLAAVTSICASVNVWHSSATARQFPGHLGPSLFIATIGVSALCTEWSWRQRCEFEGRLSLSAAIIYVTGDTLEAVIRKGGRLTRFYIKHGLHAWMAFIVGLCGAMLLLVPRLEPSKGIKLKDLAHIWFAVAWAWFIYQHKQPNDIGTSMHWTATAWIIIGGVMRAFRDSPKESGAAYILAAYTFFGGQTGLTLSAAEEKANVGSYILVWHAIPFIVILLYCRIFLMAKKTSSGIRLEHEIVASAEDGLLAAEAKLG